MSGRSYFGHDEMALAFAARAGRLGGAASVDWWPAPHHEQMEGHDGDWVVVWDVPDAQLHELVGASTAAAMLRAVEKYERASCG